MLAAVCLAPIPQGLPVAGQYMLGMLLFAVILWMTEAVDYAVSAVIITALMALLLGTARRRGRRASGTSASRLRLPRTWAVGLADKMLKYSITWLE